MSATTRTGKLHICPVFDKPGASTQAVLKHGLTINVHIDAARWFERVTEIGRLYSVSLLYSPTQTHVPLMTFTLSSEASPLLYVDIVPLILNPCQIISLRIPSHGLLATADSSALYLRAVFLAHGCNADNRRDILRDLGNAGAESERAVFAGRRGCPPGRLEVQVTNMRKLRSPIVKPYVTTEAINVEVISASGQQAESSSRPGSGTFLDRNNGLENAALSLSLPGSAEPASPLIQLAVHDYFLHCQPSVSADAQCGSDVDYGPVCAIVLLPLLPCLIEGGHLVEATYPFHPPGSNRKVVELTLRLHYIRTSLPASLTSFTTATSKLTPPSVSLPFSSAGGPLARQQAEAEPCDSPNRLARPLLQQQGSFSQANRIARCLSIQVGGIQHLRKAAFPGRKDPYVQLTWLVPGQAPEEGDELIISVSTEIARDDMRWDQVLNLDVPLESWYGHRKGLLEVILRSGALPIIPGDPEATVLGMARTAVLVEGEGQWLGLKDVSSEEEVGKVELRVLKVPGIEMMPTARYLEEQYSGARCCELGACGPGFLLCNIIELQTLSAGGGVIESIVADAIDVKIHADGSQVLAPSQADLKTALRSECEKSTFQFRIFPKTENCMRIDQSRVSEGKFRNRHNSKSTSFVVPACHGAGSCLVLGFSLGKESEFRAWYTTTLALTKLLSSLDTMEEWVALKEARSERSPSTAQQYPSRPHFLCSSATDARVHLRTQYICHSIGHLRIGLQNIALQLSPSATLSEESSRDFLEHNLFVRTRLLPGGPWNFSSTRRVRKSTIQSPTRRRSQSLTATWDGEVIELAVDTTRLSLLQRHTSGDVIGPNLELVVFTSSPILENCIGRSYIPLAGSLTNCDCGPGESHIANVDRLVLISPYTDTEIGVLEATVTYTHLHTPLPARPPMPALPTSPHTDARMDAALYSLKRLFYQLDPETFGFVPCAQLFQHLSPAMPSCRHSAAALVPLNNTLTESACEVALELKIIMGMPIQVDPHLNWLQLAKETLQAISATNWSKVGWTDWIAFLDVCRLLPLGAALLDLEALRHYTQAVSNYYAALHPPPVSGLKEATPFLPTPRHEPRNGHRAGPPIASIPSSKTHGSSPPTIQKVPPSVPLTPSRTFRRVSGRREAPACKSTRSINDSSGNEIKDVSPVELSRRIRELENERTNMIGHMKKEKVGVQQQLEAVIVALRAKLAGLRSNYAVVATNDDSNEQPRSRSDIFAEEFGGKLPLQPITQRLNRLSPRPIHESELRSSKSHGQSKGGQKGGKGGSESGEAELTWDPDYTDIQRLKHTVGLLEGHIREARWNEQRQKATLAMYTRAYQQAQATALVKAQVVERQWDLQRNQHPAHQAHTQVLDAAATKTQALIRGSLVRRNSQEQLRLIVRLQAILRGLICVRELNRLRRSRDCATLTIQRIYRGVAAGRITRRCKHAVVTLQILHRRAIVRRHSRELKQRQKECAQAALTIQGQCRQWLARHWLSRLRNQADREQLLKSWTCQRELKRAWEAWHHCKSHPPVASSESNAPQDHQVFSASISCPIKISLRDPGLIKHVAADYTCDIFAQAMATVSAAQKSQSVPGEITGPVHGPSQLSVLAKLSQPLQISGVAQCRFSGTEGPTVFEGTGEVTIPRQLQRTSFVDIPQKDPEDPHIQKSYQIQRDVTSEAAETILFSDSMAPAQGLGPDDIAPSISRGSLRHTADVGSVYTRSHRASNASKTEATDMTKFTTAMSVRTDTAAGGDYFMSSGTEVAQGQTSQGTSSPTGLRAAPMTSVNVTTSPWVTSTHSGATAPQYFESADIRLPPTLPTSLAAAPKARASASAAHQTQALYELDSKHPFTEAESADHSGPAPISVEVAKSQARASLEQKLEGYQNLAGTNSQWHFGSEPPMPNDKADVARPMLTHAAGLNTMQKEPIISSTIDESIHTSAAELPKLRVSFQLQSSKDSLDRELPGPEEWIQKADGQAVGGMDQQHAASRESADSYQTRRPATATNDNEPKQEYVPTGTKKLRWSLGDKDEESLGDIPDQSLVFGAKADMPQEMDSDISCKDLIPVYGAGELTKGKWPGGQAAIDWIVKLHLSEDGETEIFEGRVVGFDSEAEERLLVLFEGMEEPEEVDLRQLNDDGEAIEWIRKI